MRDESRSPWPRWLERPTMEGAVILLIAVLLAYVPAMRGGYTWDDDAFVTDNPVLREGLHGLRRLWFELRATDQYYPMAYSTFWLEYRLWGLSPGASHLVNVLIHAANAGLLWLVLWRLRLPGAWLAAAIFALHPMEVESAGWITERKNVLSCAFYLAAVLAWFRFSPPGENGARGSWRHYFLALGLYLCGLWSKTVVCSLPLALGVVQWWKAGRFRLRDAGVLAPMLLIGMAMGLLTAWMESHVIGARGDDWVLTVPERFLIAGRALWFYPCKLAWPLHLAFFYTRWRLDAGAWWQWLYPASAAGLFLALWHWRGRLGRGPLAAALFYAVTLFPALGFINVYPFRYSFVADHFQYLAGIGIIALGAAGCSRVAALLPAGVAPVLAALPLCGLGALAWRQAGMYADIQTFYRTAIDANPGAWIAHDNLSVILLSDGQPDQAIAQCRRSLDVKPDDPEAHVNLGNALAAKGDREGAAQSYLAALAARPGFPEAHSDLGNILLFQGRLDEAIAEYRKALAARPAYAEASNNLGYALLMQGRAAESVPMFERALQLKPDYDQAKVNLARARSLAN